MSRNISVVIPHQLGRDPAKERIAAGIPKFEPTFGRAATLEQAAWSGDTLTFGIRAMGVRATGTVAVTADEVRIDADLPLVLAPFSGVVERAIGEHGGLLLMPPLDRQAVVQRAKQAARATGRHWRLLSDADRKVLMEQSRQELREASNPSGPEAQTQQGANPPMG